MHYCYILYSEKFDKYYIGYTTDINDRLRRHNSAHKGFTNTGKPWILCYFESFEEKTNALKREKELKSWKNKAKIKELIEKS